VRGFQAMTAFARAPAAKVETLRMSRSASSLSELVNEAAKSSRCVQHVGGKLDQRGDLDLLATSLPRAEVGSELERPHFHADRRNRGARQR